MKRHQISASPKRAGRYMVGSEDATWFGSFRLPPFGPSWELETDGREPSSPLTWWANEPRPGLKPK